MNKQRVAILVDKSGSMCGLEKFVRTSFNEQVQTIKDKAKDFDEVSVSLVTFNHAVDFELFERSVDDIKEYEEGQYIANGGTALRDAIGVTIDRLKEEVPEDEQGSVLFVIITDGEDMSSTMFSQPQIAEKIQEMKSKGWTFTYLGTDHDVESVTRSFGIDASNVATFSRGVVASGVGAGVTQRVTKGLNTYFACRSQGVSASLGNFYGESDESVDIGGVDIEAQDFQSQDLAGTSAPAMWVDSVTTGTPPSVDMTVINSNTSTLNEAVGTKKKRSAKKK